MNRDPRLLYGADIRRRILDEVAADIARLATRRKVRRLVSVGIGEVEEIAVYIRGQARAAAVDIGINKVTDADENCRIVGDADTGPLPMSPAGRRPYRAGSARSRWQ